MNYQKTCIRILSDLPQKHKEVVLRRFGLENDKRETLESIGQDFGVTRERVRQIESNTMERLEDRKPELKDVFSDFNKYLKSNGGLKREDIILADLGGKQTNPVYFLLTLGNGFYHVSETQDNHGFWTIEDNIFNKVNAILTNLIKTFEKEGRPVLQKEFIKLAKNEKPELFHSSFEVSKKIEQGPLGEFGLVYWSEVKPKGVRDKAYLALKKNGKPLHFKEIAVQASDIQGHTCKKSQVYPQTVHNELIKDDRFVLVGRGVYGLKQWGYVPGTVKDVIISVLKEKSLSKDQVIKKVSAQRLVKDNTILLNLQNRSLFLKDSHGKYTMK